MLKPVIGSPSLRDFSTTSLLILIGLIFSQTTYAGWYTNCPACASHLGGSGVAGPFSSQSECESERASHSSYPWQPCYSSDSDSSGNSTAEDAANAARWEAYYRAKEEARLEKANELKAKAQGAQQSALNNSQTLEYLYQQAAGGGVDFDGRNVKSSQVKFNKTTGRYDMNDLSAEHKIKDSGEVIEDDPFTLCMHALPDHLDYGVDLAAVKNCGNTPFFNLGGFTSRFDPKTLELFMEGMKKIPGVDNLFKGAKIWGFAAKLAGLWELAWIAKINDEMMPIGGAPTKKDVRQEFEKLIKETAADSITDFMTDKAADQAKEFLHPEVLLQSGIFVEPIVKVEMAPLNKQITQWIVSDQESAFELSDNAGEGTTSFFKGLPK